MRPAPPPKFFLRTRSRARYPFYNLEDIRLGSINLRDEGYWDGGTVFDWLRHSARERSAEYIANEVVGIGCASDYVTHITLASGETVSCGTLVNASGPRAAMAGITLPVEPRKRFTWIFTAEQPLDRDLPLTIDPSGVHVRQDGPDTYLAGCAAGPDPAVDYDDFVMDHNRWQDHVWPILANRSSNPSGWLPNGPVTMPSTRLTRMPSSGRITSLETSFSRTAFPAMGCSRARRWGSGWPS